MHKNLFTFAAILALIIIIALIAESANNSSELQKLSSDYTMGIRDTTNTVVQKLIDENEKQNTRKISRGVKSADATLGNFEGPQVHFYSLRHWGNEYTNVAPQKGLRVFQANTFNFDPDHDYFGLPNVVGTISPVKFHEPESNFFINIKKFLPSNGEKPYKVYRKKVVNKENPDIQDDVEIQLWLMEFDVAVTIMPNIDKPSERIPRGEREVSYPSKWYSGSANHTQETLGTSTIQLRKLDEEIKNYRYNDLEITLKVIPNNAPWYFLNDSMQNERPDIGIGAIYCESLRVNAEDTNRISPNLHKGMALELYKHHTVQPTNKNTLPSQLDESAEILLNSHSTNTDTLFWNKDYYTKVYFNNIGSWKRKKLIGSTKRADQVIFSFIMPIFVKGSWDIKAPNVIIPDFQPPKAFQKKFPSWDWIPDLGLGKLGIPGAGKTIFIIVIALFVMSILSPYVKIFGDILSRLLSLFGKKNT